MKKINKILTFLFILTSVTAVKGQTKEYIQAFIDKDCYITGEQMMVHVSVTDAEHRPMDMSRVAYVELCDTKQMQAQCMVQLKDGEGWAMLDLPGSMHSGNYQMNVYTRYQRNFGPEYYYKRIVSVINLLNPSEDDDVEFIATPAADMKHTGSDATMTDKKEYQTREKVTFKMPKVEGRSFTLSVTRKDCKVPATTETLKTPQFKNPSDLKFLPEIDGHILTGKATDGKRINNTRLALVGKSPIIHDGQIQSDGTTALYYSNNLFGSLSVCLNGYTFEGDPVHMEFEQPYEIVLPDSLPSLRVYYDENDLKDRSISSQIEKSKRDVSLENAIEHEKDFMGIVPERFYDLDEYTKFKTVREILIEFISGIRTRNVGKRKQLYTLEPETRDFSKWAALVLLDGMPVYDIDALMDYDARRLKYVQIYRGRFVFGVTPCQGVISFISRKGSMQDFQLDEGTQMYTYDFPQNRPVFLSPIYDDKSSRMPDFRHTLYFNPQVNGECEFYTSDLPGTYEVSLQYVGTDNKEHKLVSEFIVK